MRMNPVLNKELIIGSRTIKFPLALCIYNLVLGLIAVLMLAVIKEIAISDGVNYQTLMALFPILATVQCFIILIMIPILTASSIAGERERQTLDVMLTAPISSFSIVLGKVFTAMIQVLMFVISSIPIMSVAFIFGGMKWTHLFGFILLVIYASFFVGAIGVYSSAKTKKTVRAVINSFVWIAVFMIGTLVAMAIHITYKETQYDQLRITNPNITENYDLPILWATLNPAVTVGNYVFKTFFGSGLEYVGDEIKSVISTPVYFLTQHWTVCTVIITTLVALVFVGLAARNINPRKKVKAFKKEKQSKNKASEG